MQQGLRFRSRMPPVPRVWPIHPLEVWLVLGANVAVITGMWLVHGGLRQIGTIGGLFTAAGQITALYGTLLALVGIVLMARSPWLDQIFGLGGLVRWHRWVGFATLWLLVAHGVFTTVGFAIESGSSILDEISALLFTYPWVLMATVALGLMVAVGVASVKAARKKLSYETWFGIHLYAYLAVALAFLHELVVGTDFVGDQIAIAYWIGLYVAVVALVVVFRIGQPILLSWRHDLRVADVRQESQDTVSIYITGYDLDRLAARAGQFFYWRFLSGGGWWRAHPFSLSAAPNGKYLRITVKQSGDDTRWIQRITPGTRVFAEGPYGAFTSLRLRYARVLLIAGGIGITPLRALLEEFRGFPGAVTLLYRASTWEDVVFRDEIDSLAQSSGREVHYLVGKRGPGAKQGPVLDARAIRRLVPDIRVRDVFLCGPDPMMHAVRRALHTLDVSDKQIHVEQFAN
ncbi:MAG: ferredoxin reductase family protein [Chloroflexota bacterium]